MDQPRDPKRPRNGWPEYEQPNGQRTDSSQLLTPIIRPVMLDPRLSGALARMHHEIRELTDLVKALQESVNELKESMTIEFEVDDGVSESESSDVSAQTI